MAYSVEGGCQAALEGRAIASLSLSLPMHEGNAIGYT